MTAESLVLSLAADGRVPTDAEYQVLAELAEGARRGLVSEAAVTFYVLCITSDGAVAEA